jgi:hypothetical protein
MKKLVTNYSFNAATGEVTLPDLANPQIEGVLLITNLANNEIIYNFADPAKGGSMGGNVLGLGFDTSSMQSSDPLQIFYDDGSSPAQNDTLEALAAAINVLQRIAKNLESLQVVDGAQRQRVTVDSIAGGLTLGTVATVNNVNAVASVNQLGGVPTTFLLTDIARQAFATGIRRNLTFAET